MKFSGTDTDTKKAKLIDADGKFSTAVSVLQHDVAQCFDDGGPSGVVVGTYGIFLVLLRTSAVLIKGAVNEK